MEFHTGPGAAGGRRLYAVAVLAVFMGVWAASAVQNMLPDVEIVEPKAGELVTGARVLVVIDYFSNSNAPIEYVELWIDESRQSRDKLGTPRLQGRVKYEWDSTRFKPGMHSLEARAIDQLGYKGTAVVSVSSARPGEWLDDVSPYIRLASPAAGATVSGKTTIEVEVHPGEARFVYVMLRSPGAAQDDLLCATTDSPYVFRIDATDLPEGRHEIYAVAKTEQGEIQSEIIPIDVVSTGGGTYTGPELPSPNLTPSRASLSPELAIPELSEAMGGGLELPGGGLVSQGIVLAQADVSRILSLPGDLAAIVAPAVADPTPVAVTPTPVVRPQPEPPRPVAPVTPVTPVAPRPEPVVTTPPVPTITLAVAPRSLSPITAGPARSVAAVASVAAPRPVAVAPTPKVEPTPVMAPKVEPRLTDGTPSYARPAEPAARTVAALPKPPTAQPKPEAPAEAVPVMAATGGAPTGAATGVVERPLATPIARVANAARVVGANKALVRVHVVRPGETLAAVARRYGVSARRIGAANGLGEDEGLASGSRLTIPPQTTVLFDDTPIAFDVAPQIINGISVAPIRHMLEAAGGTVYWIGKEQLVRAEIDGKTVEVRVGSREARVDEERVLLDLAAFMKQDRVLVPVRFVGSVLDVTVKYDPVTENVHIVSHTSLDDSSSPAA